jgi:AmmeMemoRadiSam system protein A
MNETPFTTGGLPQDAGGVLLALARAAIASQLGREHPAAAEAPWLRTPGACFVTLTKETQLRGCIGSLQAHRALLEDVRQNAVAAAFRDPRFSPLSAAEYEYVAVEVSVLSAQEPLSFSSEGEALAQLRVGIDGVVFAYGRHTSTFLPQVWENFPDPVEFMAHLKYKAGLPPDFWDEGVRVARYTVAKWREDR